MTIHFHNKGAASRGKPRGVHGVEIRWGFCESPPDDVETLSHSEFDTRSPHTLVFKEGQRGQKVSMVLRWENGKGEKGPWGELGSAVVP